MIDLTIGNVAIIPVVIAIIELAKRYLGLTSKWAPLANLVLTTIGIVVVLYVQTNPAAVPVTTVIMQTIVTLLSTAGVYDLMVQPAKRALR